MDEPRPGPWSRPPDPPPPVGTAVPPALPPRPEPPPSLPRERAFNAPWVVVALTAILVFAFLGQLSAGPGLVARYALVPMALSAGRFEGLLGHVFLHWDWLHLILNAAALVAFGTPVARAFGSGPGGAFRFCCFFLACGAAGGLAFWALQPAGAVPVLGASGAVSGLIGGAARLIERRDVVGHPFSRAALGFIIPWIVLNLLIALAGAALGPAVPIAWEAHLGGLVAGLLLLGLFAPPRRPASPRG